MNLSFRLDEPEHESKYPAGADHESSGFHSDPSLLKVEVLSDQHVVGPPSAPSNNLPSPNSEAHASSFSGGKWGDEHQSDIKKQFALIRKAYDRFVALRERFARGLTHVQVDRLEQSDLGPFVNIEAPFIIVEKDGERFADIIWLESELDKLQAAVEDFIKAGVDFSTPAVSYLDNDGGLVQSLSTTSLRPDFLVREVLPEGVRQVEQPDDLIERIGHPYTHSSSVAGPSSATSVGPSSRRSHAEVDASLTELEALVLEREELKIKLEDLIVEHVDEKIDRNFALDQELPLQMSDEEFQKRFEARQKRLEFELAQLNLRIYHDRRRLEPTHPAADLRFAMDADDPAVEKVPLPKQTDKTPASPGSQLDLGTSHASQHGSAIVFDPVATERVESWRDYVVDQIGSGEDAPG